VTAPVGPEDADTQPALLHAVTTDRMGCPTSPLASV
jgi:hypothetical protein